MKKFYLQGKIRPEGRKTFDFVNIIINANTEREADEKGRKKYPGYYFRYKPQLIHDEIE